MLFALPLSFTSCSSDDDDSSSEYGGEAVTSYDDLSFFQNAIIQIDSVGTFKGRVYGSCLLDNDTTQLFIGVRDLAEADSLFHSWLAPDVVVCNTAPSTTNLTVALTDEEDNAQGTVFFQAVPESTAGEVAVVTFADGTDIKHFSKITFLLNDAWPYNYSTLLEISYKVGETYKKNTKFRAYRNEDGVAVDVNEDVEFVCIREGGNGKNPYFVGISHNQWHIPAVNQPEDVANQGDGRDIGTILCQNWDYWVQKFSEADGGQLCRGKNYFINWHKDYWFSEKLGVVDLSDKGSFSSWEDLWKYPAKYILLRVNNKDIHKTLLVADSGTGSKTDSYDHLFDGDLRNSHWYNSASDLVDGWAEVEFHSRKPGIPTGLTMTTAYNSAQYPSNNPGKYELYGKQKKDDAKWTKLWYDFTYGSWKNNNWLYSYAVDIPITKRYQYFKFVVRGLDDPGTPVQIGELWLKFQD